MKNKCKYKIRWIYDYILYKSKAKYISKFNYLVITIIKNKIIINCVMYLPDETNHNINQVLNVEINIYVYCMYVYISNIFLGPSW